MKNKEKKYFFLIIKINNKNVCYEQRKMKEYALNLYYLRNGKTDIEKAKKGCKSKCETVTEIFLKMKNKIKKEKMKEIYIYIYIYIYI